MNKLPLLSLVLTILLVLPAFVRGDDTSDLGAAELEARLVERVGDLKAAFGVLGVATQIARNDMAMSPTNLHYPARLERLDELIARLGEGAVPSQNDLGTLRDAIVDELHARSQITRFVHGVQLRNGERESRAVVRVGSFNVVSAAGYLIYDPQSGELREPRRQPEKNFVESARALANAESGLTMFGVDMTGGRILDAIEKLGH